jgi:hypothetical protein
MSREGSEVDAHDDAPERGPADFTEPSGGEHTCGADVEFSHDCSARRHRVSLDRAGAALLGEVGRGAGECRRNTPLPEAARVTKQVTAQTVSSVLSSSRSSQGTRLLRSKRE